ncbi:MAG: glycosyl hydrolase [Flammeovirgaceae bacterium TMED290]|nr:MAG: glycosyl hydrolase [Flammeovirgaceae bacterium TMED290]|tara:strand:+ start:138 stop:3245 length:3108 start_codon:yes stop_codon:yes gene_type:complete
MKNSSVFLIVFLFFFVDIKAQKKNKSISQSINYEIPNLNWRSIGPYRGGRASSVTGVSNSDNTYYFGATGGGIWKTTDSGQNWRNISDGFFGGSIGAISASESDPNILYVGTGEKTVRGNVSPGYGGFWKSDDAGETWKKMNLDIDQVQVGRIAIHPKNPDIVYIGIIGDLFKDSNKRGVYKSTDGGESWRQVLFSNERSGAVDISIDKNNPRIIFASTWNIRRTPYSLESGGEGSGLWKSTDGGETWTNISDNEGLPSGIWGISGVSVSPVNSKKVFALIENKEGGLFRSDDGGSSWEKVNEDRNLRQRAWYYTRVYADTQNENRVYVMNVSFWRSEDGGKSFDRYRTPHGDHHDLWIDPENNKRLIVADDGGAQVSSDDANNWSTYMNQPTAQYYRVATDNSFPYNILVAQQDNSTQRVPHRVNSGGISERDWERSAGGESAHLAAKPDNPDIVYGGSYGGYLTRLDHSTGEVRSVNVWPNNPMGHGAEDMKFRFQWNFPIFFSPHDPNKLYTTSNRFHVSYNEGEKWEVFSPDLTRNEKEKLGPSGGPITKDNTAVEYYATIFAACESPYERDLLWAASDDGLIHLSRDGGKNWEDVTPDNSPKYLMWNSVEPDPFVKGGLYAAGTLYKTGDFQPYMYKTKDYGKTWEQITNGIPNNHFTRVLRADPNKEKLLYAGTESGMYISFDDGISWNSFQLNLPLVPITDLTIKNNNLIAATQGRSLWLIDDLTPLHQLSKEVNNASSKLFKPIDSYRMGSPGRGTPRNAGKNHHNGVEVFFNIDNKILNENTSVTLEFLDNEKKLIKKYDNQSDENVLDINGEKNSFVWNMRYDDAKGFDGLIMWSASLRGPIASPGQYFVKLTVNEKSEEQSFNILKDPRSNSTDEDLKKQFDFLLSVRDKVSDIHQTIIDIRSSRSQLIDLKSKISDKYPDMENSITGVISRITLIEEKLYQTKNKSGQDPLNFPIRLNNKLAHLTSVASVGNFKPTDQMYNVRDELIGLIDKELKMWNDIKENDLVKLNSTIIENNIQLITIN